MTQKSLTGRKETQDDWLDRTYWNGCTGVVFEYGSKKDIEDPTKMPIREMSLQEARDYLETLEPPKKKLVLDLPRRLIKKPMKEEELIITYEDVK